MVEESTDAVVYLARLREKLEETISKLPKHIEKKTYAIYVPGIEKFIYEYNSALVSSGLDFGELTYHAYVPKPWYRIVASYKGDRLLDICIEPSDCRNRSPSFAYWIPKSARRGMSDSVLEEILPGDARYYKDGRILILNKTGPQELLPFIELVLSNIKRG